MGRTISLFQMFVVQVEGGGEEEHQLPQPGADHLPAGGEPHAGVPAVGRLGSRQPHALRRGQVLPPGRGGGHVILQGIPEVRIHFVFANLPASTQLRSYF